MEEDNAMCLNARDYKGVCNQGINGVAVYPVEVSTTEVKPIENEAHALLARDYKGISTYGIKGISTYGIKGISTYGINGAAVKVPIRENVKKGYSEATYGDGINLTAVGSHTRRGRIGKGVAQTLDTGCNQGVLVNVDEDTQVYAVWHEGTQSYIAIRKLTPKECFRLQGWTDDYFEKAALVNSDTQLYKQAGNGITVNVVQAIATMINEVKYEGRTDK